jgi:hypothetical protein
MLDAAVQHDVPEVCEPLYKAINGNTSDE